MYGMKYERIEVRLDPEHVRKVSELRAKYGASTSEIVRKGIDAAYEEIEAQERRELMTRLLGYELPYDAPEPEELSRQLDQAHDLCHLDEDDDSGVS
jgi:hypothetical protein